MEKEFLFQLFSSVLETDSSEVVLCDLNHRIVYMNSAACAHYARFGGRALVGRNLLDCHNESSRRRIAQVVAWFQSDSSHQRVHTFYSEKENTDIYMVALRSDSGRLIGYYEKHECRERDTEPFYNMEAGAQNAADPG